MMEEKSEDFSNYPRSFALGRKYVKLEKKYF
jgi:hypothetical protein